MAAVDKDKLVGMANKLKLDKPKTPIQEVSPIRTKEAAKEETAQLNVWIPKELVKKMKIYGLENDLSLKEITTKALNDYLK
ncbi:hypothetical protein [Pontibacter beigongshangensis]|uniref:hypothetical protein n=1 Tax=Pontibacter beigongshangensis TaxID=2574733 RepID=UPI001650B521|nr:hypothetical protein [Pontibacter beigongshangensis]